MNVLLLTSHAIAEHDDLDMFTRMGVNVYSIGGAYDTIPFEGKRPAVPNVQRWLNLEQATNDQRARLAQDLGDPLENIDWGKARLHPAVVDWADVVIVHHFPEQWIGGNWDALNGKRIVWRTCGQSDPRLEHEMTWFRQNGLEIVRYSPKEKQAFGNWGTFAGQDAMIRFGKDPEEWFGWNGEERVVGNITQDMAKRGDACGLGFWDEATKLLPTKPAGPGSEALIGGIGQLTYEDMRAYLRRIRVYLYTGTRPASYTLGLIEAMMTGTPVVYMGPDQFQPSALWEFTGSWGPCNTPQDAHAAIQRYLNMDPTGDDLGGTSRLTRHAAIQAFGLDTIMPQWHDFLGTGS